MDKLKKKLTEDVQKFRIKKANDSSTLETGNHNKFLTQLIEIQNQKNEELSIVPSLQEDLNLEKPVELSPRSKRNA